MLKSFTMDYWIDEGWYIGKLREVPGVFSQGETLDELEANIKDAFALMAEEMSFIPAQEIKSRELLMEVS